MVYREEIQRVICVTLNSRGSVHYTRGTHYQYPDSMSICECLFFCPASVSPHVVSVGPGFIMWGNWLFSVVKVLTPPAQDGLPLVRWSRMLGAVGVETHVTPTLFDVSLRRWSKVRSRRVNMSWLYFFN